MNNDNYIDIKGPGGRYILVTVFTVVLLAL